MATQTADVVQNDLDQIDYENEYTGPDASQYAPPLEGRYVGKLGMITNESFFYTNAGKLALNLPDVEIVSTGAGNGYRVRYQRVYSTKYKNKNTSQMLELLRAAGSQAKPKTNDEMKQALRAISGKTFQFQLQWVAYDKETQEETVGQENFPTDTNGVPVSHFDVGDRRVFANGKIRYYVSAFQSTK